MTIGTHLRRNPGVVYVDGLEPGGSGVLTLGLFREKKYRSESIRQDRYVLSISVCCILNIPKNFFKIYTYIKSN